MFKTFMIAAATSALLATSVAADAPEDDTTCLAFASWALGLNQAFGNATDIDINLMRDYWLSVFTTADLGKAALMQRALDDVPPSDWGFSLEIGADCSRYADEVSASR